VSGSKDEGVACAIVRELAFLPSLLDDDELVAGRSESYHWLPGLLVVTNRRLLFVRKRNLLPGFKVISLRLEAIKHADAGNYGNNARKIRVWHQHGLKRFTEFSRIVPPDAAAFFAALINSGARGSGVIGPPRRSHTIAWRSAEHEPRVYPRQIECARRLWRAP
jgi:hypothetical protein